MRSIINPQNNKAMYFCLNEECIHTYNDERKKWRKNLYNCEGEGIEKNVYIALTDDDSISAEHINHLICSKKGCGNPIIRKGKQFVRTCKIHYKPHIRQTNWFKWWGGLDLFMFKNDWLNNQQTTKKDKHISPVMKIIIKNYQEKA